MLLPLSFSSSVFPQLRCPSSSHLSFFISHFLTHRGFLLSWQEEESGPSRQPPLERLSHEQFGVENLFQEKPAIEPFLSPEFQPILFRRL